MYDIATPLRLFSPTGLDNIVFGVIAKLRPEHEMTGAVIVPFTLDVLLRRDASGSDDKTMPVFVYDVVVNIFVLRTVEIKIDHVCPGDNAKKSEFTVFDCILRPTLLP